MDAKVRLEKRTQVAELRRKPNTPQRIFFPIEGMGECVELELDRPLELCIEATDSDGNTAPWLTDEWWIEVRSLCRDRLVTVVILPTRASMTDPVLLHQLEMIRRIAPQWRLIGYAYTREVLRLPEAQQWVVLPFDEIRFSEDPTHPRGTHTEYAQKLIDESMGMPTIPGFQRARLRLVNGFPYQVPRSKPMIAPQDADNIRQMIDRVFLPNPI